jgi:hypothetical protein
VISRAYYKVAHKRFVDTVCMQYVFSELLPPPPYLPQMNKADSENFNRGADHYLVTGPDTPLKVFSPNSVAGLTDMQLEAIAGEELGTKRKSKQLQKEIRDLEAGKKILI